MSTYDSLLDLADTLIQENGYQGFSYADLASKLGIRKASIHYHFPAKTDLGIAYCERKEKRLLQMEESLLSVPPGKARLAAYIDAFAYCAQKGQMCGVHAMLSDSNLFEEPLQEAVSRLAQTDLRIIADVLRTGRECGELAFSGDPDNLAVIINAAVKGALMLNRVPPHDACERAKTALQQLLCTL
ncbi:TetR/AcrR family transcriptional regulator [Klebsiella aerogenes]|uniref:TetR/AcrR family transcriptional regulator n=1 Tax=Klebsiella aerogenes TaxID=548 RepID=A0AAP9R224_KLEAE|nr:TetR/AcrR family transcriptional regulator [Klebsiella aerogenes]QMR43128.1 TetR/AcrR family transcriptional regulator [Klebsiella aerogenes]